MTAIRSMLARVEKLEAVRAMPKSPFDYAYGSYDAFEADTKARALAGTLDLADIEGVLASIRRWNRDGVWGLWCRDRIWEWCG